MMTQVAIQETTVAERVEQGGSVGSLKLGNMPPQQQLTPKAEEEDYVDHVPLDCSHRAHASVAPWPPK